MDGVALLRPRQRVLPAPIGLRGISSDAPWHGITSHQGARGRWIPGSTAIPGRWAQRYLRLTDKGNEVIARDPFEVLVRAVGSLDAGEQTAMHDALHQVLTTVAASGAHRHFGVCQDCAYLGGDTCCSSTSATGAALECRLFGVPIQPEDGRLLCVHFEPKSDHREGTMNEFSPSIC